MASKPADTSSTRESGALFSRVAAGKWRRSGNSQGNQHRLEAYRQFLVTHGCSATLEKHRGKVSHGLLLLQVDAPVHKSNMAQAGIEKATFTELNHPACSPDIALAV